MSIDLDDLEAKARAATQGGWVQDEDNICVQDQSNNWLWVNLVGSPMRQMDAAEWSQWEANAAYIVAAQPSVVLELIARVRGLEEALRDIIEWDDKFRASLPSGTEKDPLTRAVDRARTALGGSNG